MDDYKTLRVLNNGNSVMGDMVYFENVVGPVLKQGEKHHITLLYDENETLYINGDYKSYDQAYSTTFLGKLIMGESFKGKIQYFRIYNRLLTNEEIQQNYEASAENIGL